MDRGNDDLDGRARSVRQGRAELRCRREEQPAARRSVPDDGRHASRELLPGAPGCWWAPCSGTVVVSLPLLLASDSRSVARFGESSEGRYWVHWLEQRHERLEHDNRHERAKPGKLRSVASSEGGVDIVCLALHVGCDSPRWLLAMNCFNFIFYGCLLPSCRFWVYKLRYLCTMPPLASWRWFAFMIRRPIGMICTRIQAKENWARPRGDSRDDLVPSSARLHTSVALAPMPSATAGAGVARAWRVSHLCPHPTTAAQTTALTASDSHHRWISLVHPKSFLHCDSRNCSLGNLRLESESNDNRTPQRGRYGLLELRSST